MEKVLQWGVSYKVYSFVEPFCHLRTTRRIIIDKTQRYWDKQSREYDFIEHRFDPIYKQILAKTGSYCKPGDTLLDFGCATGTKTLELAGCCKQVIGIDFSPEMIRRAKKKCSESGVENGDFIQGTIFSEKLDSVSFDTIVAFGILHQLDEKERILQRIHHLLQPDGLFIATTACMKDDMSLSSSIEFSLSRLFKLLHLFPLHLNLFTASEVSRLVAESGFEIVEEEVLFQGITISFVIAKKRGQQPLHPAASRG